MYHTQTTDANPKELKREQHIIIISCSASIHQSEDVPIPDAMQARVYL